MARRKKDAPAQEAATTGKKKRGRPPAQPQTTAVTGVVKLPSQRLLTDLMRNFRTNRQKKIDADTDFSGEVRKAVDNHGLHKKAFAAVRAIDRMEPEALADFLAHRDDYEEKLGIRKRADSVMRMDLKEGERVDGSDDGAEEDNRNPNVATFPRRAAAAAPE